MQHIICFLDNQSPLKDVEVTKDENWENIAAEG